MIKTKKHKIVSLFMAMMIFISSLGYSLDVHYCGGEFFDFSLIGNVKACQAPDSDSSNDKFVNRGCCDFDQFKIETSNSFEKSSTDLNTQSLLFEIAIINYSFLFKGITLDNYNKWVLESPPEIKTNKVYFNVQSILI